MSKAAISSSSSLQGSSSTTVATFPPFEHELNRILAPLNLLFADGNQKDSGAAIDEPADSDPGMAPQNFSNEFLLCSCSDELLQWQKKMKQSLKNGHESIQALTLVQKAVESLAETLQSVEEDQQQQQQQQRAHAANQALSSSALSPNSATATTSTGALKDNKMSDHLSLCLEKLESIYTEVDNANLDVNSSRFGILVEELHVHSDSLRSFPLPASVRDVHYRKISFAYDRIDLLLRDAIQSAVEKSTRSSTSALHDAASKLLASLPSRQTPNMDSVLASPAEAAVRVEQWSAAFSTLNAFFLDQMEDSAPLRRIFELVGKDVARLSATTGFASPGSSASVVVDVSATSALEKSLAPLFDGYIRHRTHCLLVLLRWWLYHDKGNSSVDATHLAAISSSIASPDELSKGETKVPVAEVAAASTSGSAASGETLPHLVEELVFVLEAFTQLEKGVVERIWWQDDFALAILPPMHAVISESTYSVFRSHLLCVDDVHELSQTVEMIEAVRVYCSQRKWLKLADLWVRMIQDTQERLIFRTSMYLRQHVAGRTPTKEWGQKYSMLYDEEMQLATATEIAAPPSSAPPSLEYFPTFPSAVELLQALHRTLSSDVFSVLAEESIRLCLTQVSQLSRLVHSTVTPASALPALLTALMHLHFLHHHLSSMDANMTVVERKLDFRQSLRFRKIKIVESSRETMQSVENQFAECYQKLVEALTKGVSAPAQVAGKADAAKHAAALAEVQKLTATYERLLLRFIPDPWLRAKILLPVYQFVESYKA